MKRFLTGAIVAISLFAMASQAKAQFVNGVAYYQVAGGSLFPAPGFGVKFCKADPNNNYALISGACAQYLTNGSGAYGFDVLYGSGWYFMYLWRNDMYWGSETYPISAPVFILTSPFGQQMGPVYSRPRALPPVAINPADNSVNRPTSFTLQWSDGLDSSRRDPNWTVTYDIYASGNEYPELLVFSNIPCNGVGTCSVNVSGLTYTIRYQWRVVAKMRSPFFVPNFGDNVYLTSSQTLRFSTMFDLSTPSYSFRTNNSHYLTAPDGGGGDFVATASSIDLLTSTFKIKDINGGQLLSGDTVNIQTNRNYYLTAYNAGGGDVATIGWAMGWETFTIVKLDGSGQITGGEITGGASMALISADGTHYLVAEGGGGGTVNCDRTAIGPWETFTLVQQ